MEPSKGNTVAIVKSSPSLRATRKTLKFFKACSGFFFPKNGKDNKPNHPWLLELPLAISKDQTNDTKPTR